MGLRNSLVLMVVIASIAACGAATQPTPIVIYVTQPPVASSTPRSTPTSRPTPTPSPKPTPSPGLSLEAVGELEYDANACWSQDFTDSTGHYLSGVKVNMALRVRNSGETAVRARLGVTAYTAGEPDYSIGTAFFTQAGWDEEQGPPIPPRSTATLQWAVLIETPFDAHYKVWGWEVDPTTGKAGGRPFYQTLVWTSTSIC